MGGKQFAGHLVCNYHHQFIVLSEFNILHSPYQQELIFIFYLRFPQTSKCFLKHF